MANGEEKKEPTLHPAILERFNFHYERFGFKENPVLKKKLITLLLQEEHPFNISLGTPRRMLAFLRRDLNNNKEITNEHLLHIVVDALLENHHHGLTNTSQQRTVEELKGWMNRRHEWDKRYPSRIPEGLENITKKQFILMELEKKFDSKGGKPVYTKSDILKEGRFMGLKTYLKRKK